MLIGKMSVDDMRMPHMRGDEPVFPDAQLPNIDVCPTCVGMNRTNGEMFPNSDTVCPTCVGRNCNQDSALIRYFIK